MKTTKIVDSHITCFYTALHGRGFGYPECCIDYFRTVHHSARYPDGQNKLLGSGFIPCTGCSHIPMTSMINEINHNRFKALKPFKPLRSCK